MKRVYLDQNKWIDLARVVYKKGDVKRFESVLLVLRAGVSTGEVSLPLSSSHYMETAHRRSWRSRRELGATMIEFSRMHSIAAQTDLLPGEIDAALKVIFERPLTPREVKPFGYGASHAFGEQLGPYVIPDGLRGTVEDPRDFERRANELLERYLLVGPKPDEEPELENYDPMAHLEIGERYAVEKEKLRSRLRDGDWHKGERGERVAKAIAISDHLPLIDDALKRAGIPEDDFMAGGKEGLSAFVEAVPTMLTSSELERYRHAASQKPWEANDLRDIGALSVAIAHCDIVVTENLWTDAAKRSGIDQKLGTVVLSQLEDLTEHLLN
jgi:hypothetical protein